MLGLDVSPSLLERREPGLQPPALGAHLVQSLLGRLRGAPGDRQNGFLLLAGGASALALRLELGLDLASVEREPDDLLVLSRDLVLKRVDLVAERGLGPGGREAEVVELVGDDADLAALEQKRVLEAVGRARERVLRGGGAV